ncbi:predicted protein [Plenodomus lingam JN3]|uniref:Predicted protein n=1 Tax=Leptosphaeria maculans (strain JN3 / isolate v23.1.3 / race Av1-4-5-6-7-8) TaxID=985895 RepID=E5AE04_LEPMJ|nr:predicted protein [Plenodomus lingam JN3]CBY01443.1 predicted protein [Plenodomus lingam JN3]
MSHAESGLVEDQSIPRVSQIYRDCTRRHDRQGKTPTAFGFEVPTDWQRTSKRCHEDGYLPHHLTIWEVLV